MANDEHWADGRRLEAWAGEVRVNLIRAAALVVFYGHHLLNVYVFGDEAARQLVYHASVTAVVLAWSLASFLLYFWLGRRWVPSALKYVATFWDTALLTGLLALTPEGPRSPLLLLYFVVIAAAPLRLSLPLVYAATLGCMAAYLLLVGHYVFFRVGAEAYYTDPALRIPRAHEVIVLLSLGTAGLLAGQTVRQARRLVQGPPVTVEEAGES